MTPRDKLFKTLIRQVEATGLEPVASGNCIYVQTPIEPQTLAVIRFKFGEDFFRLTGYHGPFPGGKPTPDSKVRLSDLPKVCYGDTEAIQGVLKGISTLLAQHTFPMGPFLPTYLMGWPPNCGEHQNRELHEGGFRLGPKIPEPGQKGRDSYWQLCQYPKGWNKVLSQRPEPYHGAQAELYDDRGRLRATMHGEGPGDFADCHFFHRLRVVPGKGCKNEQNGPYEVRDYDEPHGGYTVLKVFQTDSTWHDHNSKQQAERLVDTLYRHLETPFKLWGETLKSDTH